VAKVTRYGPYDIPIPGAWLRAKPITIPGDASGTYDNAPINVTGHPWKTTSGGSSAVYVSDQSIVVSIRLAAGLPSDEVWAEYIGG
jgi:hypothetical protein